MSAQWQGVNSLMLNPCKPGRNCEEDRSVVEAGGPVLREMRWNADLQNSASRRLINETHSIFLELQSLGEDSPVDNNLVRISKQYRCAMQARIMELRLQLETEEQTDVLEDMETQLDLLSIMEMIWNLVEILLIDSQPGGYCLPQLLEWVKGHFTEADRAVQSVMSAEDPYAHADYWRTMNGFVLQGRLSEVADLLTHHPGRDQSRFDEFASMDELLRKMPTFEVYRGQPAIDFLSKWKAWKAECGSRLNNGDFKKFPPLENICELLTGEESSFESSRDLCQSWYEMMVAKLLYTDPTVTSSNLKRHALPCINTFSGVANLTPLDEIILAVFALDVHKVIEKSSEHLPNWWFAAHITDLLHHTGKLASEDESSNLREFLLLEYSSSLMSHQSMGTVAADYLMTCSENGRQHLEAYLERMPIDTEKKAMKVIRLCEKFGFTEQVASICKVMGMKALRRRRLGVALSWCLRSKDEEFASFLTEQFLSHYSETGSFVQSDLISNLGTSMFLNNKLTFLAKYHEFHLLYGDKKFKEAGLLLTSLLTSSLAPKRFWLILLLDSLPLLENEEPVLGAEQTFELMHRLKELQLVTDSTNPLSRNKPVNQMEEDDDRDKLELLQLALSRNLSRALLIE